MNYEEAWNDLKEEVTRRIKWYEGMEQAVAAYEDVLYLMQVRNMEYHENRGAEK